MQAGAWFSIRSDARCAPTVPNGAISSWRSKAAAARAPRPQRRDQRARPRAWHPNYADDKVFEEFYSLARPHSQRKSTGLGLPFAREIAALYGGRISLHNAEGGGVLALLTWRLGSGKAL